MKFEKLKNFLIVETGYQIYWIDEKGTKIPVTTPTHAEKIVELFPDQVNLKTAYKYAFDERGWIRVTVLPYDFNVELYGKTSNAALETLKNEMLKNKRESYYIDYGKNTFHHDMIMQNTTLEKAFKFLDSI